MEMKVGDLISELPDGSDNDDYDIELRLPAFDDETEIHTLVKSIEWDHNNKKLIIHGF